MYEKSPEEATEWYYRFSQDTDYIRRYRVQKDMRWKAATEYGNLDITINLSKPEKDPKAIAAAKAAPQSGYPKCLLCPENEGYAGRINHPARQNHRIIPLKLDGEDWNLQYSPYVYYPEHCIVFNSQHTPMVINRDTLEKLLDSQKQERLRAIEKKLRNDEFNRGYREARMRFGSDYFRGWNAAIRDIMKEEQRQNPPYGLNAAIRDMMKKDPTYDLEVECHVANL